MLWWIDFLNSYHWSNVERSAFRRIWGIAIPLVIGLIYLIYFALRAIGIPDVVAPFAALIPALFGGFYLSRRICLVFWADLIGAADANARHRLDPNPET